MPEKIPHKSTDNKRVAAYCRVSAEKQAENTSIANQKEKIIQYCKLKDYNLVAIYTEKAKTGSSIEARPQYGYVIDFATNPENNVSAILCYKADLMHRSLTELMIMIDKVLTPKKIAFVSVTEDFDTSTPTGRLFLQMLGSFAEFERETTLSRCREGRHKKAKNNEFAGGGIPYGYVMNNKELIVDSAKADIVLEIFKKRAGGDSLKRIADALNKRGLKSSRGGDWNKQGVAYVLRNRAYTGEYSYDGTKENNGIIHTIPRIVTKNLFTKVNTPKAPKVQEQEEFGWDWDRGWNCGWWN